MRGKLFEFAVLYHPRINAQKALESLADTEIEVARSTVLVQPKAAVADSEDEIRILAAREIPEEYASKVDQLEILVRPFGPSVSSKVPDNWRG